MKSDKTIGNNQNNDNQSDIEKSAAIPHSARSTGYRSDWGLYDWYHDKWIEKGFKTKMAARKRKVNLTQGKRGAFTNFFRSRVVAIKTDSDLSFWRKYRQRHLDG